MRTRLAAALLGGAALTGVIGAPAAALAHTAPSQAAPDQTTAVASATPTASSTDSEVEELVVTARDKVGLLETRRSQTVFGLPKPLVETPRAATFVSDQTLERYGVEEVDDLVAVTPGAFTASFYGVKGAVNLRGTLADSYFRGFRRIENRGTYPTPLGAAAQVEILRGPPTPAMGPGKVGGVLNIQPKSARLDTGFLTEPIGQLEVTGGSYGRFNANAELGLPLRFGDMDGGLFAYVEREDSDSFYRGIHPERWTAQLSADLALADGTRVAAGYMRFTSSGDIQTPGWNRVSQALVDDRLYQTGRDTTLRDLDGNGRLTPGETGGGLVDYFFGFPPTPADRFTLDTGVGLAKIDRRTVFVSDADFSETTTDTAYLDVSRRLSGAAVARGQLFYDDLENSRFVSYGFPALYKAWAAEARLSLDFSLNSGGRLRADSSAGLSYRRQRAEKRESFNGGYLALDRRDLVFGPTPTDIFDSPFSAEPAGVQGLGWDYDNHSAVEDRGLFLVSDIFLDRLNLTLGARYDWYDLEAHDSGALTFAPVNDARDRGGDFSWSASLSYKTPWGLIPYVTYADSAAIEFGQAGDVAPSLIASGQWLSKGELKEAGIKFSLLNQSLVGAVSWYEQSRTRLGLQNSVASTEGTGVEAEVRWVASKNLSFTAAAARQKTTVLGPDTSFVFLPPYAVGLTGPQAYGGGYAVFSFADLPRGYPGNYELRTIPEVVVSAFGSFVTDPMPWGQAGVTVGGTHTSETSSSLQNPVVYPAYWVVNAQAFVTRGPYQLSVNVDNLLDAFYVQPVADTYANLAVLPGRGREWRVTLKRRF